MFYVYPQLSRYDFFLIRMGGPGLGNLLFPFAEALVLAKNENLQMVWPTWGQLKVGPFIRREKDKRMYFDLFQSTESYIKKWKKLFLLLRCEKISREHYLENKVSFIGSKNTKDTIIVCSGMEKLFSNIIEDHELIKNELEKIRSTKNQYGTTEYIGVHIRFGDFHKVPLEKLKDNISNARLPIEWYTEKIDQVRKIYGSNMPVQVFSDANDNELKDLLSLPGVVRAHHGNSVNDLLALSRSRILIASNSSFSMWASYLGRMPVIWYKGLVKQRLYYGKDAIKEIDIGLGENLPENFRQRLLESGAGIDL